MSNAKRPNLVLLTSHWVSMLGVALVTTVGFSWLFVLGASFAATPTTSLGRSLTHPKKRYAQL